MFSPDDDEPGPSRYDTPLINVSISGIWMWLKNRTQNERIKDDDFLTNHDGAAESDKNDQ